MLSILYQITLTTTLLLTLTIGTGDGLSVVNAIGESSGGAPDERTTTIIAEEFERNNKTIGEEKPGPGESDRTHINQSEDVVTEINAEIDTKNKKKKLRPAYKTIRGVKAPKGEKFKSLEEYSDLVLTEKLSSLESAGGYGTKINATTATNDEYLTTQEVQKINEVLDQDMILFVGESTSTAPAIVSEYGYVTTIAPVTERLREVHPTHLDPIFKVPIVAESPALVDTTIAPIVEEKATTSFLLPISSEVPVFTDDSQFEQPLNTTYLPFGHQEEADPSSAEIFVAPVPNIPNEVDEQDQAQEEAQLQPQIQQLFVPNKDGVEIQKSIERHVQHLPYQVEVQNLHLPEVRLPLDLPEKVVPTQQYVAFAHDANLKQQPYQIPIGMTQAFYLPLDIQKPFPIFPQNYMTKPYVVQQIPLHIPSVKQVEQQQYKAPDFPKFRMMDRPHPVVHHYQVPFKQQVYYAHRDSAFYAPKPSNHIKNSCAELKQMGIYKSYCSMNLNNYIGLVPPKHFYNHFQGQAYVQKQRKARQNFESSIRMEYGFMPPLIPSLQIDELGNPIEPHP